MRLFTRNLELLAALSLISTSQIVIAADAPMHVEEKWPELEPLKPHREPHNYPNTNQMAANNPRLHGRNANREQRRAGRRGRG